MYSARPHHFVTRQGVDGAADVDQLKFPGLVYVSVILMLTVILRAVAIAACVAILRQLRQWKFDYFVGITVVVGMVVLTLSLSEHIAGFVDGIRKHGYSLRLDRDNTPMLVSAASSLLAIGVIYLLLRQRKAGEAELLTAERRWNQVVESAPIGVFVSDGLNTQRTYINPVLARMLGCSANYFEDDVWLSEVLEEDRQRIISLLSQCDTEQPVHLEFRYRVSEKQTGWARLIASQVNPTSKVQTRWIGMVTDITEGKVTEAAAAENWTLLEQLVDVRTAEVQQANLAVHKEVSARGEIEIALRETNSKLHALMHHVPDSIITVDRQGTVLFVNRSLQPCGRHVTPGTHFLDYLPRKSHTWYRAALASAFEDVASAEIDDVSIGQSFWRMRLVPIHEAGLVGSCMIICTETTPRKRAEEKLRVRDAELAHVSRVNTVGEMMAGVAHEIAQPLAAISNYSAVLKNSLNRNGTAEVDHSELIDEANKKIKEQADRAAKIISGFRSFVSNVPPEISVVDLHELVHEAVGLNRVTLRQGNRT